MEVECVEAECRACEQGEDGHERLFYYVLPTTICLLLLGPLLTWRIQRYALSTRFSHTYNTAINLT